MLTGPEKIVRRVVFLFLFAQHNLKWPMNHMLLSRVWTASPICSKEATYPAHIRFWCDSDIECLVVYIKNWWQYCISLWLMYLVANSTWAGGDASFIPQANLVCFQNSYLSINFSFLVLHTTITYHSTVLMQLPYRYMRCQHWCWPW